MLQSQEEIMPISFSVRLTDKDMYRFNMYHAYTSLQGILSVAVAVFIILVTVLARKKLDQGEILMYLALALVFVLYMPISLKMRSKRQIALSEVLQSTLHYTLDEHGITVAAEVSEETAVLPWDMVYKVVSNKKQILIYSNRVNAYVIPRECLEGKQEAVIKIFRQYLEDYRLHLKN